MNIWVTDKANFILISKKGFAEWDGKVKDMRDSNKELLVATTSFPSTEICKCLTVSSAANWLGIPGTVLLLKIYTDVTSWAQHAIIKINGVGVGSFNTPHAAYSDIIVIAYKEPIIIEGLDPTPFANIGFWSANNYPSNIRVLQLRTS